MSRDEQVAAKPRAALYGEQPPVITYTSGSSPRRWFARTVLRRKLFGREVWIELRWRRV